jgi:chemotaxis protein methyltransferase CheR
MMAATEALRGFVRGRAGISMGAEKDYLIRSRLEPHLGNWRVSSLDALAAHVGSNPHGPVAQQVVAALTINETLWFRDGKPFDYLRQLILPSIVERKTDQNLSIWSAACSTGQEVYSIAMTLADEEAKLRGWNQSIMGSDICEPAVERAKTGSYSQFEVQRGLPIQRLVRNFTQKGQEWVVRPELRGRVSFKLLNLMELPPMMGPFDVVFCRNVLIYFDVDTKRKVLSAIAQRMKPNGYLLLGSAETTLGVSDRFALVPSAAGLYRLV